MKDTPKGIFLLEIVAVFVFLTAAFMVPPTSEVRNRAECYAQCEAAYRGYPTHIARCKANCDRTWR